LTDLTPTDFRALCAELVDNLERYQSWYIEDNGYGIDDLEALLRRADAALAQPEPQGPTDKELGETYRAAYYACENRQGPAAQVFGLRAVLARWGRPAIEPVPVAERLPGPGDCDAEGWCWWFDGFNWMLGRFEEWYTHWLPHHALPVPQQEAE
jgi:hypothetical protein